MSTFETWFFVRDGELYRHFENDGPGALRKGLEQKDTHIGSVDKILQALWKEVATIEAREREACAVICEEVANKHARVHYPDLESVADECAGAIRARGET